MGNSKPLLRAELSPQPLKLDLRKYVNVAHLKPCGVKSPGDDWYFSPELIPIRNFTEYQSLTDSQKKRVSLFEAVNFFSVNISGKKQFIHGLKRCLADNWPLEVTEYFAQFIVNENYLIDVLQRFCKESSGKVYQIKSAPMPREFTPGEKDVLFFARGVIFQKIVEFFNQKMLADYRLSQVVRNICLRHHQISLQHVSFGEKLCRDLVSEYRAHWPSEVKLNMHKHLVSFTQSTWRDYYNPQVYLDGGFANAYDLYESAWDAGEQVRFRQSVSENILNFIESLSLLPESDQ